MLRLLERQLMRLDAVQAHPIREAVEALAHVPQFLGGGKGLATDDLETADGLRGPRLRQLCSE